MIAVTLSLVAFVMVASVVGAVDTEGSKCRVLAAANNANVCGQTHGIYWDSTEEYFYATGQNQGDKAVECTYLNTRAYSNDPNNSTGGWEMKISQRMPATVGTCYVHSSNFDYSTYELSMGGYVSDLGYYTCYTYICYATTRHHFEQLPPGSTGLREFYTAADSDPNADDYDRSVCWDNSTLGC